MTDQSAEKAHLLTEPHDGHEPEVTCPGCPHPIAENAQPDFEGMTGDEFEAHPDSPAKRAYIASLYQAALGGA